MHINGSVTAVNVNSTWLCTKQLFVEVVIAVFCLGFRFLCIMEFAPQFNPVFVAKLWKPQRFCYMNTRDTRERERGGETVVGI
jgi:hypothetical protein